MKLCINCHTLNADDAVFCSECGMSLINVPTGQDALKLREAWEADHPEEAAAFEEKRREQAHRPPLQPLTTSGIVYVFGHLFAPPWDPAETLVYAGRAALALKGWGNIDSGRLPVMLPYSAQPVAAGHLGPRLLEAAFVSLAQEGYISLGVEKTKTLFVSGEAVTISRQKAGDDLPPSLERSIMDVLTSAPQERQLKHVVRRLPKVFGQWTLLVNIVAQSLREAQWLGVPEAHSLWSALAPTEEAAPVLAAMAEDAKAVKASLDSFAAANPHLHKSLVEHAVAGVRR